MRHLLYLSLFLALSGQVAEAGPLRLVRPLVRQAKKTFYTDVKAHPFAWGVNLGLQFGIVLADATTTCLDTGHGIEAGPAHYFIGRHPNCKKAFLFMLPTTAAHVMAEDWLMNAFTDSCYREAAKPDSRWWKTPAHTHNPESCRWAVPVADTIAIGAYEIPAIKGNIDLLKEH
jgi:hypothetical protein